MPLLLGLPVTEDSPHLPLTPCARYCSLGCSSRLIGGPTWKSRKVATKPLR